MTRGGKDVGWEEGGGAGGPVRACSSASFLNSGAFGAGVTRAGGTTKAARSTDLHGNWGHSELFALLKIYGPTCSCDLE